MTVPFRRFAVLLILLSAAALACGLPSRTTPNLPSGEAGAATQTMPTEMPKATLDSAPAAATDTPAPTAAPDAAPTALPTTLLRVAYTDGEKNLWIWVEGGGPVQLTSSGDVTNLLLSPDGEEVVFVRNPDYVSASLWAIRRNGSNERQLLSQADLRALSPLVPDSIGIEPDQLGWVPGTGQLAMATRVLFDGPGLMRGDDLTLVDLATGGHTVLLARGQGGQFVYSPDGSQIALSRTDRIDLVNADGSNRREGVLSFPFVSTYSEYAFYPDPVWAADGSSLVVAIPPATVLETPGEPTHVWRLAVDGSGPTKLGSIVTRALRVPLISPDATKMLYLLDTAGSAGLYSAAVDGTGAERYSDNAERLDSWVPGSDRFVFYEHAAGAPKLGSLGAMAVPLSDSESVFWLQYTGDGRVVYEAQIGVTWEIHVGPLGGPSTLIATFPGGENIPILNVQR